MKIYQRLTFLPFLMMSCHTPAIKPPPTLLKAVDTTIANPNPGQHPENNLAAALKTHLRDTTFAAGSFILFLRPDNARYDELEKEAGDEAGDADSDFGVGISNTQNSLKKNDRYKDIKVLTSTDRFIYISDCKNGPLIIDRDSVSYGYILSAKGMAIAKTYNSVHSGDFLGEIEEYFFYHGPR